MPTVAKERPKRDYLKLLVPYFVGPCRCDTKWVLGALVDSQLNTFITTMYYFIVKGWE